MRSTVLLVLVSLICAVPAHGAPISVQSGRSGAPDPLPPDRQPTAVYQLPPDLNGNACSSEVISAHNVESEVATDFVIPGSGQVVITRAHWWGAYFNTVANYPHVTSFIVDFYSDGAGCLPGTPIATYAIPNNAHELFDVSHPGGIDVYEYYVDFQLTLNRGQRYWCSVRTGDHVYPPQWGRLAAASLVDCQSAFRGAFFGYPNWVHANTVLGTSYDASLVLYASAPTVELITILTGQVGGQPDSTCGHLDDCFRWYAPNTQCPYPIINPPAPIPPSYFQQACAGPYAPLITSPVWGSGMNRWLVGTPFTSARWINFDPGYLCDGGNARSVLYCCTFQVQSQCADSIRIDACWKVDDYLGDTANNGLFIDGQPLGPAFRGGNWSTVSCASQTGLQLGPGTHRLEVYQQDLGCNYSGLEFGCTITLRTSKTTIAGRKWIVPACTGTQTPAPGWIMRLRGTVNDSTVTDGSGNYSFSNLPLGHYSVTERTVKDWIQCQPLGGVYTAPDSACSFLPEPFENSHCDFLPDCTPLPASLVSWYTFDEGSGNLAKDFAAGVNAGFSGAGQWVGDPCGAGGHGADLTSATPLYLTAPSKALENDMTIASFAVFAWVRMSPTAISDGVKHYIVDKRSPGGVGYSLYLLNGKAYCDLKDGSGQQLSCGGLGTPLTPWVSACVGLNVCRNASNPSSNTATLYVNCVAGSSCGNVPSGSLSNAAPLTIGTQSNGTPTAFLGYIDDLQIYKGRNAYSPCLTAAELGRICNSGDMCHYCKKAFYVPSVTGPNYNYPSNGPRPINLSLCNFTGVPQNLTWTIAGLAPNDPCCNGNRNGPTVFSPYSGTINVPAYNTPPSCTHVYINTAYVGGPPWIQGDNGCYQITIQDPAPFPNPNNYAYCNKVCGSLSLPPRNWVFGGAGGLQPGGIQPLVPGTQTAVGFMAKNLTGVRETLYYRLSDHSADGDSSDQVVSLNGLPPGTPVLGTLTLSSGDSAAINVEAELTEFQPLNVHEVQLSVDWNHTNRYEPAAVVGLQGVSDDYVAGVPPETTPAVPPPVANVVTAAPNPFVEAAEIEFSLDSRQSSVLVDIYDVGGRLVRELNRGPLPAGVHRLIWDGKDTEGRRSGAGIYFIRVQTSGRLIGTKLVRLE